MALQHAFAQWSRLHREGTFRFPRPSEIVAAISGGAPVNAGDLQAVVLEELSRLRRELRTSDNTPWKRYWNLDRHGRPLDPRIENECRDHLLDRLRDRLERYRITAALPESRRADGTRADVMVLTGAGRSLPIEVKRHSHGELWNAASSQLEGYARTEGSDGLGIYLVFWFGVDAQRLPAHPRGLPLPSTAEQLEEMLRADLAPDVRERIRVLVFDVSKR